MLTRTRPVAQIAEPIGGGGGGGPAPTPPPGGGGGGQPGCNLIDTFKDTTVGAGAETQPYYFTNPGPNAVTITDVVLNADHPELWTLDASQLAGVLLPGETRAINLTFTPPAK